MCLMERCLRGYTIDYADDLDIIPTAEASAIKKLVYFSKWARYAYTAE